MASFARQIFSHVSVRFMAFPYKRDSGENHSSGLKRDSGEHHSKGSKRDSGEYQSSGSKQDSGEPQSSGSKQETVEYKRKGSGSSSESRRRIGGFSDSFSTNDLVSLSIDDLEDETQEVQKENAERSSTGDCASAIESETSKMSTPDREESEATSRRASTSGTEDQANPYVVIPWLDLFRRIQNFHVKKAIPKLTRRKSKRNRDTMVPSLNSALDCELCYLKPSWKNFSLAEIKAATNNFSPENLIGEGGYAEVYRGKLEDGRFVAIKRLMRGSQEEMTMDYLSELGIIVHVDHPNIAKLIGYGVEGGMHLVLQLSVNGSLSSLLYEAEGKEKLKWDIRYKVALGTAQGLQYLHEQCQRRIIHRDIKASNILLTEDFEPQISDFGLAKWLPEAISHHTVSQIEGTFGYLPPEFFMHGIVDEKTDVYAYGVLLLELITGKQALDSSQQSLVIWAKPLLVKNKLKEFVDPTLEGIYDTEQMDRLVSIASLCIHQTSVDRPQMSEVVKVLKGNKESLKYLKQRQNSKLQRTYSDELFDADDYNSTKYLRELNHHMELLGGAVENPYQQNQRRQPHNGV